MTFFQSWVLLWQCLSQGGGRGTPIISYIHRFGTLFWVQNYSKMKILGHEEIVDFLGVGVITKLEYFGGPFLYIVGLFKVNIQNGNVFGTKKFQIFFGYA